MIVYWEGYQNLTMELGWLGIKLCLMLASRVDEPFLGGGGGRDPSAPHLYATLAWLAINFIRCMTSNDLQQELSASEMIKLVKT